MIHTVWVRQHGRVRKHESATVNNLLHMICCIDVLYWLFCKSVQCRAVYLVNKNIVIFNFGSSNCFGAIKPIVIQLQYRHNTVTINQIDWIEWWVTGGATNWQKKAVTETVHVAQYECPFRVTTKLSTNTDL